MRKNWTKEEEEKLAELYKEKTAKEIAEIMSLKVEQVKRKVFRLGLKKSKEWKINKSREIAKNNIAFKKRQFKKGHVPYNKGKKLEEYATPEAIARMKKTQFKKGNKPKNTKPDYAESLVKQDDTYYWKIKLPGKRRMVHKHIWLWEKHYGKIPKGKVVVFKDGDSVNNCTIENLECISRIELMLRNSKNHDYPKELIPEYAKIAEVKNLINKKWQK